MLALAQMMREGSGGEGESLSRVLQHVQRLLNTRQGQSCSAPDYGTSLCADTLRGMMTLLPQTLPDIEQALVLAVQSHETRYIGWRLRKLSLLDGRHVTLFMMAKLERQDAIYDVAIDVQVFPSGRIKVGAGR